MQFDTEVKMKVYEMTAQNARIPNSKEVATELGRSQADIEGAFIRLSGKRLLVQEPDDRSKIRMAPPFSGVETTFRIVAKE